MKTFSKFSKPTEEQFLAYQQIFDYFNESLFGGELPGVILNFSRMANTHGFFAPNRWASDAKGEAHEISLNPETFVRPSKDVLSTLVHEMAHLWQQEFGKPSRRGYHNKEWAKKMEEIGLMPSDTGAPGGKPVGQKMSHYIVEDGPYDRAFQVMPKELTLPFVAREFILVSPDPSQGEGGEDEGEGEEPKKEKPKGSKLKYSCPECSSNVWGKEGLNLVCGDCSVNFVLMD